jgi:hypothetical protein
MVEQARFPSAVAPITSYIPAAVPAAPQVMAQQASYIPAAQPQVSYIPAPPVVETVAPAVTYAQ